MPNTSSAFIDLSTFVNELGYACSSETASLQTGQALETNIPFDMTVTRVYASLNVAPSGSSVSLDVNINGSTILNNNLIFSHSTSDIYVETSLFTLGLSKFEITKNDNLTVDLDTVDIGTATGLKVYLIGHRNI